MKMIHIVAMSNNRCIGIDNALLWHLPTDLKYFKDSTENHVVVMGKNTIDSLPKPLPNRLIIQVAHEGEFNHPKYQHTALLDDAVRLAAYRASQHNQEHFFIAGGASVYSQTLNQADELWITQIDDNTQGNKYYPEFEHLFNMYEYTDWFNENGIKFRFTKWSKK